MLEAATFSNRNRLFVLDSARELALLAGILQREASRYGDGEMSLVAKGLGSRIQALAEATIAVACGDDANDAGCVLAGSPTTLHTEDAVRVKPAASNKCRAEATAKALYLLIRKTECADDFCAAQSAIESLAEAVIEALSGTRGEPCSCGGREV